MGQPFDNFFLLKFVAFICILQIMYLGLLQYKTFFWVLQLLTTPTKHFKGSASFLRDSLGNVKFKIQATETCLRIVAQIPKQTETGRKEKVVSCVLCQVLHVMCLVSGVVCSLSPVANSHSPPANSPTMPSRLVCKDPKTPKCQYPKLIETAKTQKNS